MSRSDYSEDQMLQAGTAEYFEQTLGWERNVFAFNQEDYGADSLLGRENRREVVLFRTLREKLRQLNPLASSAAIETAMRRIAADDAAKSLVQLNEDKHRLLRDGVTLEALDDDGRLTEYSQQYLDFERPENNDFCLVRELWVDGEHPRRADLVGFVNGLPLLFIELKRYDKGVKLAYDDNLNNYKRDIRPLFFCNTLVVLSNGHDALFGSVTSPWEHFYRWRRLNESDPPPPKDAPLLKLLLRGMCNKTALLDITQNFVLFDRSEGETAKIIARNHQYLGVNRVVDRLRGGDEAARLALSKGQLGVFWHTQGSGKSYSMVFLARKVLRAVSGRYSFLVVTDRIDLDEQIARTFAYTEAIDDASKARIPDSASLAKRLAMDLGIQFCIVHKFRHYVAQAYSLRDDVIVLSDEAHRTQYGKFAWNMRKALPNAKFLGFTGTPLMAGDERQLTREVFGDYVSVYDFQLAVEDDSTVKLFYQNAGERLKIDDPDIHRRLEERIVAAREAKDIDADQEEKIYRQLAKEYPLVTSDSRLSKVAAHLVQHYSHRWKTGKALMVCWDKLTCGRMYALISAEWQAVLAQLILDRDAEIERLHARGKTPNGHVQRLNDRIDWMQETEICVVISGSDSSELAAHYEKYGLDLAPHARKLAQRELDVEFKRPEHPFRLAIVCAMWLTGFDVKSLATLYLDKPMQGHTLMQAIARVNRIYKGKDSGLIIDYNGMIKSLRKALATFARQEMDGGEGNDPVQSDDVALAFYYQSVQRARDFLEAQGFQLSLLMDKVRLEKLEPLVIAVGCVKESDQSKAQFNVLVEDMRDKFKALFPHPGLAERDREHSALEAVYNKLNESKVVDDVSGMLLELYDVVDGALGFDALGVKEPEDARYDLSKINFERLQQEAARAERQQQLFDLKERIERRLAKMLRVNPGRVDLYARYQQIVREYNRDKDAAEIARLFDELSNLHSGMDDEERRFMREGFENEEQLAIYDLLTKDTLKPVEINKIKAVAKELLPVLQKRHLLAKRWREQAASLAQVETAIRDYFWENMPEQAYPMDEVENLTGKVFQWVRDTDGHLH